MLAVKLVDTGLCASYTVSEAAHIRMAVRTVQVAKVKELRKSLPATSKLVVSKNTLMKRAVAETDFEPIAEHLTVNFACM